MSATMQAVLLTGHGGPEKLVWRDDWPKPVAGEGEILVRVKACGLNNTDINTRTGWYSRPVDTATGDHASVTMDAADASWDETPIIFPRIQGADVAGIVEAVGVGADPILIGKRVLIDPWLRDWDHPADLSKCSYFGSDFDGGFADYTKVDRHNIHVIESTLSDAELATFPTAYMTAENMLARASVTGSDTVLVSGASGGVGSALVQLAKRRGARVIALAGSAKHAAVAAIGADLVLPRRPDDLRAAVSGETVSVVADVVGGDLWTELIAVLARGGRYVCAGAIAGPKVTLDLRLFYLRDLAFFGATVVTPGIFANLVGYIERGDIRPLLAGSYPLRDLGAAQQAFIDKRHTGNFVTIP